VINFDFRPATYFDGTGPNALLCKLHYPESQWGEEISIYVNILDGKYQYEAVDYYGNDINLYPETVERTLNLQELILLIETMDVDPTLAQGNAALTIDGIPEAESEFYPQLSTYYTEKRKTFGLL